MDGPKAKTAPSVASVATNKKITAVSVVAAVAAAMEPRGPLPTYRLSVRYPRPLASLHDERALRKLFDTHAPVAHFMTRPEWRNSYVSFRSTAEAVRAKEALHGQRFGDQTLDVCFVRPTTRLIVRGLPRDVGLADAKAAFRGCARAERDGQDVALAFNSARDAEAAAATLSSFRGHALSYDFGNDRRDAVAARGGPVARGRSRSRSRGRRSQSRSRSRTPLRKRSRSRSRGSPTRRRSLDAASKGDEATKKRRGNWTPSDDEYDGAHDDNDDVDYASLVPSPTGVRNSVEDKRVAAADDVIAAVVGGEATGNSAAAAAAIDAVAVAAMEAADEGPCAVCAQLLGDLKRHVDGDHADGPVSVQKAVIRAWFECHYYAGNRGSAVGENPVAVARKTLLGEINAFLASMGWPAWKTHSALYKDWFLRDVMALTDDDIRKGRNWSLHYRDGFAPSGHVGNARTQQQRMDETVVELRKYMGLG